MKVSVYLHLHDLQSRRQSQTRLLTTGFPHSAIGLPSYHIFGAALHQQPAFSREGWPGLKIANYNTKHCC